MYFLTCSVLALGFSSTNIYATEVDNSFAAETEDATVVNNNVVTITLGQS